MLDCTHTGMESHEDPLCSVCMGSHGTAELSSFLHKGMYLILVEMRRTGHARFHQYGACEANLDRVGAMLYLFAYCLANFIDSIRHTVHAFIVVCAGLGDRNKSS